MKVSRKYTEKKAPQNSECFLAKKAISSEQYFHTWADTHFQLGDVVLQNLSGVRKKVNCSPLKKGKTWI